MNGHQGVCLQLSRYSRSSMRRSGDLPALSHRLRPVGYRTDPCCHPHHPNPLSPLAVTPPWASERSRTGTCGAGTIIDGRRGLPWQPCESSSGSSDPRETRPLRSSPAPGHHRVSPATTALRRSSHRPPCASVPPSCACLRSGLSPGAFRPLTAPRLRDGPLVAIGSRASRRWRIQGRVRRLRLRIPRTGLTG